MIKKRDINRYYRCLKKALDLTINFSDRKKYARLSALYAEKTGVIHRPEKCQWCKQHLMLERHHVNYSEPINIVFLCRECHEKADTIKYNKDNGGI